MRNKLTVRADIIRPLFTAGFALAMALTIGCSSDNDEPNNGTSSPNGNGGGEPNYNYCIVGNSCLTGPFTASTCNGQVSNSCPNNPNQSSSSDFTGTSGNFVDSRDNKSYKWIKIGTQIWMAENLNYAASSGKCYGDGGKVYNLETGEVDITLSSSEIQANCNKYGRLYDWTTAMALPSSCNSSSCSSMIQSKHKGICPQDWHIPSDAEGDVLANAVGGSLTAGRYLKSQSGWADTGNKGTVDNGNGVDAFGFSALPGGNGNAAGNFGYAGNYGTWWSASEYDSNDAHDWRMYYYSEYATWGHDIKGGLVSVRCLHN